MCANSRMTTLSFMILALTLTSLSRVFGEVHVVITSSWVGGFHGEARFEMNKTITNWQVHVTFKVPVDHIETWDSDVQKISDHDFLVTHRDYNSEVHAGDTLAVSLNGFTPGIVYNPVVICAYIVGEDPDYACPRDDITAPPTPRTTSDPCLGMNCGTGRCIYNADSHKAECDCNGTGFSGNHCEISVCSHFDCGSGTCYLDNHQPICNCSYTGFNGHKCNVNPCDHHSCGEGRCVVNAGLTATASCDCSGTAFIGDNCKVDPCAGYNCGTGRCLVTTGVVATASCDCNATGYNGAHCEINPCDGYQCGTGHCVASTGAMAAASCDCKGTGFNGDHCETNPCSSYQCGPGSCVVTAGDLATASCNCSGTGLNGDHCEVDPCASMDCGPGHCERSLGSPATAKCICTFTGFTGTRCEVDRCVALECGTGHCDHTVDNLDHVRCNCSFTGFTGFFCDVSPCTGLDCGHGTCLVNRGLTAVGSCDCSGSGYTGDHCDVDLCTGVDCGTGHCQHTAGNLDQVFCNCSYTGFTGNNCDVNPCTSMDCGHGRCVANRDLIATASCDCTGSGYNGDHCGIDPCAGYDCGTGNCVRMGNGPFVPICDCTDTGFYGDHCEISIIKNFTEALKLSQLFYYAQRSGKLPANNPVPWRQDSALTDCVPGGWYDAGDHVKFVFPMASALTVLLWGGERFKEGYQHAGQMDTYYDTVKWGLDWLLNAWDPFTETLTVQVGDGDVDHQFWGRPEDMTMARPCFKVMPGVNGSDVAAEVAAALAIGASVFKQKGDNLYSYQLLQTAESVFTFAKENRGLYTDTPDLANRPYYRSSGDHDEMCVAAVWLYKATKDENYMTIAEEEHRAALPDRYDWDEKSAACQLLLYEVTHNNTYLQEVQAFLNSWKKGGSKTYTPCGFAWSNATYWGSAREVANIAFLGLLAAEDGIDSDQNRQWSAEQLNYLLGDNPHDGGCFSYEIGYGSKYPLRPHHRAASCPFPPAPCSEAGNLHTDQPSPHVLYGGLVGGPIYNDGYNDSRDDYVHNEVALDYNAGFQSAVAGANKLLAQNKFPLTHNPCPCHDSAGNMAPYRSNLSTSGPAGGTATPPNGPLVG